MASFARPNILLVVTDDQPIRTVGLKPDGLNYWMPKLHANLRAAGTEFTRAYTAMPLCSPNRASIMTGLYPHNHNITTNLNAAPRFRKFGFPRGIDERGIGSLGWNLTAHAGYVWGNFGKYLNSYEEVWSWVPPGCSAWVGTFESPTPIRANMNGILRRPKWPGNDYIVARDETPFIASRARGFIQSSVASAEAPFFCVANFSAPHHPYNVSAAHANDFDGVPLWGGSPPPNFDHYDPNKPESIKRAPLSTDEKQAITQEWRGKMSELMDIDDAIESLCEAVNFEDTYVIYTTDNGFMLGEHRVERGKNEPYEESVRTPLLIRGPGVIEGAGRSALVSAVDIATTIYELAGIDAFAEPMSDGRSLLGHLVGASAQADLEWRTSLLVEEVRHFPPGYPQWRMVATKDEGPSQSLDYTYIEREHTRELYDMDPESPGYDPYQLNSLHNDPAYAAQIYALSGKIAAMREASGEEMRAAEVEEVAV